jgi:hypothetical protein
MGKSGSSIFRVKMEAAKSLETLVSYHIIIQRHNREVHDMNLHPRENLESRTPNLHSYPNVRDQVTLIHNNM